jgi:serine/threonine protein kinase
LLAADAEAQDFIAQPILGNVAALLTLENAPSLVGRNLGHYRVISRIGAGGMGEVYLAEDTKLGRRVALKTLPGELYGDSHILQRFRIEARRRCAQPPVHRHALRGRRN